MLGCACEIELGVAVEVRVEPLRHALLAGVLGAVNHINNDLLELLKGQDVRDQQNVDRMMIELDGTEVRARVGARGEGEKVRARVRAKVREEGDG